MKNPTHNNRLASIDALRGFDMLFIMGLGGVLIALSKALPCGVTEFLAEQMTHKAWDGFAFYDMIFPLFLFIAGLSFPFSLAKSRERGRTQRAIHGHILWRAVILIGLGLIYNNLLKLDFETMRYTSVLARIGIAWAAAALLFIHCSRRSRVVIATIILVGYALANACIVAPDAPAGASPLSVEGSIVGYIDRLFLPGRLRDGIFDPIGLLSTLPAVATAMLGMFTGEFVRTTTLNEGQKATRITLSAIAFIALGLLWDCWTPINKPLWSSSYVCFVGGLSMALFALFYWIIDVRGCRAWTTVLQVVGLNSITIYMLQRIVNIRHTAKFFFGGVADLLPEAWGGTVLALGYLVICWLILYLLYRKKIFVKI